MKEKAIPVIWRSIKALKDIIVECGEVPGTQRGDEYVNTFSLFYKCIICFGSGA